MGRKPLIFVLALLACYIGVALLLRLPQWSRPLTEEPSVHADTGDTPLMQALTLEQTVTARRLLETGADVKATNHLHKTALHIAAAAGNLPLLPLLLERGANLNARDDAGRTPLYTAVLCHQNAAAVWLLAHHADPNLADRQKQTPLLLAAEADDTALLKSLLESGAAINATDAQGKTALTLVTLGSKGGVRTSAHRAPNHIHMDALQLLLKYHADVNQTDQTGNTPLLYASECTPPEALQALLAQGAHRSARTRGDKTPFLLAAYEGLTQNMRNLQAAGAIERGELSEALLNAAAGGHSEAVRFLLEQGADGSYRSREDMTALKAAARNGDSEIVELLLAHRPTGPLRESAVREALAAATESRRPETVPRLQAALNANGNVK